jgi:hypothetical protein
MALGIKESGKRVRFGVAQPGGNREATADSRFTTRTPRHGDFRE